MRLSKNQLSIVVNPFAAPLSVEGACMALCAADPAEGGSRYIGARTVAKADSSRRSMLAVVGKTLGRDKVSVSYDLRPVTMADTSYYRNLIKAGDVFEVAAISVFSKDRRTVVVASNHAPDMGAALAARLLDAARASLRAFEADGGDRAQALASWRAQGLAAVADVIDPPLPGEKGPGALPPGDDTLKTAPGIPGPMIAIEVKPGETGVLNTEGAVS